MKKNLITSGCGILCALVGTGLYYFHGHKDSGSLNILCYIVVVVGWIFASLPVGKWLIARGASVGGYIIIAALIISNIVLVVNLNENRVQEILANDPVTLTTGTITAIESRTRGAFTTVYAIIQYSAGSELIEQEIVDDRGEFSEGQRFEIKYSIEYPEMFQLERVLENRREATDL
jgi:hypothetical protein